MLRVILPIFVNSLVLGACGDSLQVGSGSMLRKGGMMVYSIIPQQAQGGEQVHIHGSMLPENLSLELNGSSLPVQVLDAENATLTLPSSLSSDLNVLSFYSGDIRIAKFNLAAAGVKLKPSDIPPSSVCKGVIFLNKEGLVSEGEQNCRTKDEEGRDVAPCAEDGQTLCLTSEKFPALYKRNLESNTSGLDASLAIAGVSGSMESCLSGSSDCLIFPYGESLSFLEAVDANGLTPALIKQGESIGGINGTLVPRPGDCSGPGESNCVASSSWPSFDKQNFAASLAAVDSSFTLLGLSGTMTNCAANASACFLPTYANGSQSLKAINYEAITPDVLKQGYSIADIHGNLLSNPPPCGTDGQTACLTNGAFPSMNLGSAQSSKIHHTLTLGGVAGLMNDCSSDGNGSCFTSSNFPAAEKSAIAALSGSFRPALTLAGVVGTLPDCSANGSACFLPTYVLNTQKLKAISYDSLDPSLIKSGNSIAGVAGSLLEAPPVCTSGGALACVADADFPAMEKARVLANLGKIHDSLLPAGISGQLENCASENDTACLTNAAYPSVSKAAINANRAKYRANESLIGISGTMADCAADNGIGCYTSNDFPAVQASTLTAAQALFHQSLSIAGISGSISSCGTDASACYLTPFANPAQPLKAVDYTSLDPSDIKDGEEISNVDGTMLPTPAPCAANAAVGCVAVAGFPAMDRVTIAAAASKILSTQTLGPVTGTLGACLAENQAACYASAAFPALEVAAVDAGKGKIRSTVTVVGVTGTLGNCAANASNCYLPTYASGTQDLKAIDFDSLNASVIRNLTDIGGVIGNVLPRPAACASDAAVACVTLAAFPAMNKSLIVAGQDKIHSSLTLGGVVGLMDDCSADNESDCRTTAAFPSLDRQTLNSEKAKIRDSITIAGITGTMADCGANASNCYVPTYALATQPLKAINYESITPGIVKDAEVLGGVTGDYPSAAFPLTPGDAFADLILGTFDSQISTAATFGWFTRTGARQTKAGDADLVANNIINSKTILHVGGNIPVQDAWNVRVGTSFGDAETGKLSVDCRNPALSSAWDIGMPKSVVWSDAANTGTSTAHGFADGTQVRVGYTSGVFAGLWDGDLYFIINATPNTFQLSNTLGGAVRDITADITGGVVLEATTGSLETWKTVDIYNNGSAVVPSENPWASADKLCGGQEVTLGDSKVWRDVTVGGCVLGAECRFMDKISRLQWTKRLGSLTHGSALAYCDGLTYDGKSDWRLPTLSEWTDASTHQIYGVRHPHWFLQSDMVGPYANYWSATREAHVNNWTAFFIQPASSLVAVEWLSSFLQIACVRSEPYVP